MLSVKQSVSPTYTSPSSWGHLLVCSEAWNISSQVSVSLGAWKKSVNLFLFIIIFYDYHNICHLKQNHLNFHIIVLVQCNLVIINHYI